MTSGQPRRDNQNTERRQDSRQPEPEVTGIRRILVALDASAPSRAALAAAVELAERFHSELTGLFVEDIGLINLSRLPFAREQRYPAGALSSLDSDQMERYLRARAAVVRREFDELAAAHHVRSRFRIARGSVAAELLIAAAEADLLALGRLGHAVARRTPVGSTARMVAGRANTAVLMVNRDFDLARPAALIFDGSEASVRAVGVAKAILRPGSLLHVLIWAPSEELAYGLQQSTVRMLEGSGLETAFSHTSSTDAGTIQAILTEQECDILVLGTTTDSQLPDELVPSLMERTTQQLILVR